MHSSSKRVYFGEYVFSTWENVYEPAEDSFLFAENINVHKGDEVLDMGTGIGILGVLAAKKANTVVAVDVNPHAVCCAKENAIRNNVRGKMVFVQGDLFTPLSEKAKFDVIIFNAPYLPTDDVEGDSWLERAWNGGAKGRQIIDRFISEVSKHLKQAGRVLLMQSTLSGVDETVYKFAVQGMRARVVASRALPFFETITLMEATI
jgi:release factor glutamine methyltransferase